MEDLSGARTGQDAGKFVCALCTMSYGGQLGGQLGLNANVNVSINDSMEAMADDATLLSLSTRAADYDPATAAADGGGGGGGGGDRSAPTLESELDRLGRKHEKVRALAHATVSTMEETWSWVKDVEERLVTVDDETGGRDAIGCSDAVASAFKQVGRGVWSGGSVRAETHRACLGSGFGRLLACFRDICLI